jgi:protocatechuate 3,4-dioxygenase, alpha subunit
MKLLPTPSQTVGPYLHVGMTWLTIDRLAPRESRGEHLTIEGQVLDGDAQPVPDALIEIWQADADGRYSSPSFHGFGRTPTDSEGRVRFFTIKPGAADDPHGGKQSPHILVSVFTRGLLKRLVTRIYLPDEPRNADDYVLRLVPVERRGTLVAQLVSPGKLKWNVILQGEKETVFFDC